MKASTLLVLMILSLNAVGWAKTSQMAGRHFGDEALCSAWSPDEKSAVILENDGIIRAVRIKKSRPIWTRRISNIVGTQNWDSGFRQQDLKWLTAAHLIAFACVDGQGTLRLSLLSSASGRTVQQYAFPGTTAKLPEGSYPRARIYPNAAGNKLVLISGRDDGEPGQVRLLDCTAKRWSSAAGSAGNACWLGRHTLVGKWKAKGNGYADISVIEKSEIRRLLIGDPNGDMASWTTDGWRWLYTETRMKDGKTNVVRCYRYVGRKLRLQWQKSIMTSWRQDGQQDHLLASKTGWVALVLPFGTDGISSAEFWCLSRGKVISSHSMLPLGSESLDASPSSWRGSDIFFYNYIPSLTSAGEWKCKFLSFHLRKMETKQLKIFHESVPGLVDSSPTGLTFAYHVKDGNRLQLRMRHI